MIFIMMSSCVSCHLEEYYYHYYQFYRRRMAPQVDVRIVIVTVIGIISIIQVSKGCYSNIVRYIIYSILVGTNLIILLFLMHYTKPSIAAK